MEDKKEILLEDRSGAELDDKCGQAYYWNRLYRGKGIVPKVESKHLSVGALTHEDMHLAATMPDISEEAIRGVVEPILEALTPDEKEFDGQMEMLYRRLGWFVAWLLYFEPTVRENYDTLSTEAELVLARDPLWVSVTPDRVVRRKDTKHIEYWEYKTTISASTKWLMSWFYKIQIHLGIKVISEEINEAVKFGQVIGLMKGSTDYNGLLRHPYVWAYRNLETGEWEHDYQKARAAVWIKSPIWEYPGGLVDWVKKCGRQVGLDQFPMSPPVFLNNAMLDDWVYRRTVRQRRMRQAVKITGEQFAKRIHVMTFEKRTNQCRPPFGDACPYLGACWNAEIERDPLRYDFVVRQPHHNLEIIGIE